MKLRVLQWVSILMAFSLLTGFPGRSAEASNSVSGEAYGVFIDLNAAGATVTVGKTPRVVLPPEGGMDEEQVLSFSVPDTLSSRTLTVITTGSIGENSASAQSSATVEEVNILNGLVTAKLVVAMSDSTGNGTKASSDAKGSTLINLKVNDLSLGDVTPPPNTQIDVPGVGTVILNQQIPGGDGVGTTALTVNMIHVVLNGSVTGHIVVASAHSDVNFAPAPKAGNEFMTGGGRLGTGRDIATFGFNAGPRGDGLKGQLEYLDHAKGLNVHGTSITSFSRLAGTPCVTFAGTARVNNADGFSFTVTQACDHGEPGVGHDTLAISVSGPGLSYSRSGVLTGGNLQLHPE